MSGKSYSRFLVTYQNLKVVNRCKKDGIVEVFERVFFETRGKPVEDLDNFFRRFITVAELLRPTEEALRRFRAKFSNDEITFKKAFGLAMVLSSGRVVDIVAAKEVEPVRMQMGQNQAEKVTKDPLGLAPTDCRKFRSALAHELSPRGRPLQSAQQRRVSS